MAEEKIELTDDVFLTKIKEANLSDYLAKYTAKIADKRVTEGVKSYEANRNKKDLSDKERIESLETELKEMKDNKANDDKKTLVIAELKKQNLSDKFLTYIKTDSLNDPSQIAEAVTNFKNDLLEAKQAEIDEKLKGKNPPLTGDKTGTGSGMETAVREYAKKISPKE